jgi:hypothetical protein
MKFAKIIVVFLTDGKLNKKFASLKFQQKNGIFGDFMASTP